MLKHKLIGNAIFFHSMYHIKVKLLSFKVT